MTRTSGLIVAAFAATIAFLSAAQAAESRRVVVEIRKFTFVQPATLPRPGDILVWRNLDIVLHTATAKDGSWDSGTIAAGGTWETVATAQMSADYYCRFHPAMVDSLAVMAN